MRLDCSDEESDRGNNIRKEVLIALYEVADKYINKNDEVAMSGLLLASIDLLGTLCGDQSGAPVSVEYANGFREAVTTAIDKFHDRLFESQTERN